MAGAGRSNAEFDEFGRLVNTPCAFCEKPHITPKGHPSCRGHRKACEPPEPCLGVPETGLAVCKWHGGSTVNAKAGQRKRLALGAIHEVVVEQKKLGGIIEDLDETTAMLSMLREAAYNVAVYRTLVQELEARVDDGLDLLGSSGLMASPLAMRVKLDDLTAQPHIIKKFYDDERDRLMRYAKLCHDAGIAERQVHVAEQAGAWLVQMLDVIFEQLGLTPDQQIRLPGVMVGVLEVFEAKERGEELELGTVETNSA